MKKGKAMKEPYFEKGITSISTECGLCGKTIQKPEPSWIVCKSCYFNRGEKFRGVKQSDNPE